MIYHFTLMTTVVTGASGHFGANMVRALVAQGRAVKAIIHVERRALDGLQVQTVNADILDPASLDRAFKDTDMVYHLAASISLADTREMKAVNAIGTKNVVEACLRNRVKRLVHFSSIHAVAYSPARNMIDEGCPLVDSVDCSTYARSKAAGEEEVHRGVQQGLNAIIIRPSAMLGPHDYQPSFFGRLLVGLARGRFLGLVSGGFDWVDVRDVVDGAIRAAETAPAGSEYLLSGHWESSESVAAMVDSITDSGIPKFICPLWLASLAAPFATAFARMAGRRPLFTTFAIDTIRSSESVSHDKATRELGYDPRPLHRSIEDTLEWFREAGQLEFHGNEF